MHHQKLRVRMTRSIDNLKMGGMYQLNKSFARELIANNAATEVLPLPDAEASVPVGPGAVQVTGPSSNKVVEPSQRKKNQQSKKS